MSEENSEATDEQIEKCFGKYRSCSQNCRIKTLCLEETKEQEEERRRKKYREIGYIDGMDAASGHTPPEFCADPKQEYGGFSSYEVFSAIDQLDISDKCRREVMTLFRTKQKSESTESAMLELLQRLGEIYINDATGFEVMFFQILAGGNQAALARLRGCSKQNINKIVAKGKKRLEAYREAVAQKPECRLTFRELAVYHAVELCGLTYRQTAKILGVSHPVIVKCYQKMRSKGVKVTKKHPGRRKDTKKATAKPTDVFR